MIVCDYCGSELREGNACLECLQTYCGECALEQKCLTCENKLVNLKVEHQRQGKSTVQWILSNGGKRFGLSSEFDEIPPAAFTLLKLPFSTSSDYEMILFPTKTQSRKFMKEWIKEMPKETMMLGGHPDERSPDRSRYAIIGHPEQERYYVLLNIAAIRESTLHFLLAFFDGLFINMKKLSLSNKRIMTSIAETLIKAIGYYNSRYGIRFLVADEFTRIMANRLLIKMWSSYAEYVTLKELSRNRSFSNDISRYVSHKISTLFDLIRKNENRFCYMTDLVNLVGVHADALNIVHALSENQNLFRFATNKFQRENRAILTKFARQSDVVNALQIFIKNLSEESIYKDYEILAREKCRNIAQFLTLLKPTYVWMEEAYSLAMPAVSYQRQIEDNLEPWHPQFGNIDNFIGLLSEVFKKIDEYPELYPEIPIIAGYVLLQLLEHLAEWRGKARYLNMALEAGNKLAVEMDKTLLEIKRKNPESPFRKDDIATIYTGLARTCMKFGRKKEIALLLNKAARIAEKYNLPSIKCLVNWHQFILTQNYDRLLQVYNLHLSIPNEVLALEPQFKTAALVSKAVFEREGKFDYYQKAIESSTELTSETSIFDKTSMFHDMASGRILYYVTNLFFEIEKAVSQEDSHAAVLNVEKATSHANALAMEIGALFDPTWVFVLKTRTIADLMTGDTEKVRKDLAKLERFSAATTTRNFLNMAKSWCQATKKRKWSTLLDTLDLPYENRDPWSVLLAKIIESISKQQLVKKLSLFPKAVLFVEGPTEEVVIPMFAAKTGINLSRLGVGVIPLRGSSKGKYHLKFWKEVSEKAPVTRYMLVDSHAKEEAEAAIKNNLIRKSKCFVLGKGSIEDYYPIETLSDVIQALCGKRPSEKDFTGNRVNAINAFLKKNGYTEDWKIIVGKKVAERIRSDQLPKEFEKLFKEIKSSA